MQGQPESTADANPFFDWHLREDEGLSVLLALGRSLAGGLHEVFNRPQLHFLR